MAGFKDAKARLRAISSGAGLAWILVGVVAGAAAIAAVVLYRADQNAFLYFGDAVSHLTRARMFVDSRLPGVHNIGTVWLPLPHVIFLPFALIDQLFYSGIAGSLIGIPCLAGSTVLLYSILRRLTGSVWISVVCALAFGLNPNLVYLALTPMTEMLLMFFVLLSAWMLLMWIDTGHDAYIFTCAAASVCASLCRYEAWLCVVFVSVAALAELSEQRAHGKPMRARMAALVSGMFVWYGIGFWLVWNYLEYGDWLKFAHWTHQIASRTAPEAIEGRPFETARLIGTAIRALYGPVILVCAGASVVRCVRRGLENRSLMMLIFLSLPGIVALGAIVAGYAEIDRWMWNWRYMLTLAPFLAVAAALGIQEIVEFARSAGARAAIALGIFAIPVIQCVMPERVGVSTYIDAKKEFVDETQYAKKAGEQLRQSDTSGSIALVTGYAQSQRIMISSGLPLKRFHTINSAEDDELFQPLWPDEEYVVIGKRSRPESSRLVEFWLTRRSLLLERYRIIWEDPYYLILKLNPAESPLHERS
ncbi:MAG TPA: hypothetical protein VK470_14100 [Bacteroidota bacterium]|nr:hypothetical protein [Bacteroidota bacterium]